MLCCAERRWAYDDIGQSHFFLFIHSEYKPSAIMLFLYAKMESFDFKVQKAFPGETANQQCMLFVMDLRRLAFRVRLMKWISCRVWLKGMHFWLLLTASLINCLSLCPDLPREMSSWYFVWIAGESWRPLASFNLPQHNHLLLPPLTSGVNHQSIEKLHSFGNEMKYLSINQNLVGKQMKQMRVWTNYS